MTDYDQTYRVPPHDLEAEVCTLGSMVLDQDMIPAVGELVQAEDFFRPAHQTIYAAIQAIYSRLMLSAANEQLDLVMLVGQLRSAGQIEQVGGVEYVAGIVEGVPTAANALYYAKTVRDKSLLRRIIVSASDMVKRAHGPNESGEGLLSEWQHAAHELTGRIEVVQSMDEATAAVVESAVSGKGGLSLGLSAIDFQLGGLREGNYMILAARPGRGKTTMGLTIAANLCKRDLPVLYVSREMTKPELVARLMCALAKAPAGFVRRGAATTEHRNSLLTAKAVIDEWPLDIDARASTVIEIAGSVRRFTARHRSKPAVVIIDYFQLLSGRGGSRYEKFSEISTNLKAMAMALRVPIIVLSQFNRPEKGKEHDYPTMYQLKETGSLEQDADQVLLMHCPVVDHFGMNQLQLCLDKNRHGAEMGWGSAFVNWWPEYGLMECAL